MYLEKKIIRNLTKNHSVIHYFFILRDRRIKIRDTVIHVHNNMK